MNDPAPRRLPGLAALVVAALALVGLGAAIESADLFPRLRRAVQRDIAPLPSRDAVDPAEIRTGLPTISVYLAADDLKELLDHKLEQGRAWERRASVSYFDQGRLLFSADAGIRIHGGGSRQTSPRQGWRLFLRRSYGPPRFPPNLFFGPDADPLRRLVIHNDVRTDADGVSWRLVNPLAYDLARRLGNITPETKPARFFLNGEDQGLFVLTEHFDDEYFEAHRPGRRITMDGERMDALRIRLDGMRPLTMAGVAQLIDLDNLTSWFLAVVFAATRDAYQGPGQFLDEDRDRGGWFWVTWDLDRSFRNWDLDSFLYLLERVGELPRGRRESEPRAFVLTTLIAEDQQFREYLAARVDTMLNHLLTPEFVEERRAHYERVARTFGAPDTAYLDREREFFARRHGFVREIAEQWLNLPPGIAVAIRRPDGGAFSVDGFEKRASFDGTFTPGRAVVVRAPDRSVRWHVNGAVLAESRELTLVVDRPLVVSAVPAGFAGPVPGDPPPPAGAPVIGPPQPIRWRRIPAGRFTAGCSDGDANCAGNEAPQRDVVVAAAFELMATEATVAQFAAYAAGSGRQVPRQPHWSADDHPVVNLTSDDAAAFCASVGGRLPTEIEWELAARGGRGGAPYVTGASLDRDAVNGQGLEGRDRWGLTAPVASFPAGPFGLYDLTGNVWEWTSSWYREDASWAAALPAPPAPDSASYLKTVRGGSWDSTPLNLRVSRRVGLSPTGRHNLYVGIRCAR